MKFTLITIFTAFTLATTGWTVVSNESESQSPTLVAEKKDNQQYVKIALLLDTSNSMDGLINQAKTQLWDIVNEFSHAQCHDRSRPTLQISLYEYGNDNLSAREGYIRQVLGFSQDLDEISEKLFSLTTNGGEEYCGTVINTSLKQLDWGKNDDDLKLIFIAGNEPFTQGKLDFRDAISQAKEKDVIINTIYCGNFHQGISTHWEEGAILGEGDYMAIDHNAHVVYVPSPYDDRIMLLNQQLNGTYLGYGANGEARMSAQVAQDANAYEMDAGVALNRARSKSSHLYNNSQWDMVDALEESDDILEEVEEESLPLELKGKSEAEIKSILEKKKSERTKIQKEIQELDKKRKEYLEKQHQGRSGELQNAMIKTIRKQAAKKNLQWP